MLKKTLQQQLVETGSIESGIIVSSNLIKQIPGGARMPTINRVGCSYLIFYLQTRLTVGHGVHLRASTRCAPRLIAQKSGEPPLPTAISAISSHKKAPAAVIRRPSQWLKPILRLKSGRRPAPRLRPACG